MAKCQGCHGKDGLSTSISYPNLAGQREHYLIESLRKYKAGKQRGSSMMTSALKSLSDEDMANVAAYYAAIKIIVEVPK